MSGAEAAGTAAGITTGRALRLSAEELAALPVLHGESPDALEWLLDVAELRELQAHEILLRPGQHNDKLYILLRGSLTREGRPTSGSVRPGECVGVLSMLDEKPTACYVCADEASTLLAIGRKAFWRLISTSHAVSRNLLYILSSRLRSDIDILNESYLMQRQLEQKALIDSLTGLFNRFWLEQMSGRLVERAQIAGTPLGVILIDVDHFKDYNDNHGHMAGDEALRVLGATLKSSLRAEDFAVRYGGEEFVVILQQGMVDNVLDAAERLRRAVSEASIDDFAGKHLPPVTASFGVAQLQPGQSFSMLLAEADEALYRAKAQGRNCVVGSR